MIIKHLYNTKDELVATAYFHKVPTATIKYKDPLQPQDIEIDVNEFEGFKAKEKLYSDDEVTPQTELFDYL